MSILSAPDLKAGKRVKAHGDINGMSSAASHASLPIAEFILGMNQGELSLMQKGACEMRRIARGMPARA